MRFPLDLVDTHCHLTGFDDETLLEVRARAEARGVHRMICIGAGDGLEMNERAIALATRFSNIWATVGIHPHDAGEFDDLSALDGFLSHPKVVAIGETGLDFYRDWSPRERQIAAFRSSIAVAKKLAKPLIIHCRDAEEETLQILRECDAQSVGGVFHCFSGDLALARAAQELRFLVSFTGNITFKKAEKLREVVREIDLDRIMVETDTPYMAPEPYRGGPSEPGHVYEVAMKISEVRGISLEEVARSTTANAEKLFGLPTNR